MQPEERDAAYLWDMREAAKEVSSFVTGRRFIDFQKDNMLRRAVEREIEVIGEAARKVSSTFRDAHP